MPFAPPSIRPCGCILSAGQRCEHMRARKAEYDKARPTARQRGYNTGWDKARVAFLKANPVCRFCGNPAIVVDHIKAHRGDQKLFWDRSNWQPLCVPCHSSVKQSRERRQ